MTPIHSFLVEGHGTALPVAGVSSGSLLIEGSLPTRRTIHLVLRSDYGAASVPFTRGDWTLDPSGSGHSLVKIAPRMVPLIQLWQRGYASLAEWSALAESAAKVERRGRGRIPAAGKRIGGALVLLIALALFLGSLHMRYGVARLTGTAQATETELVRAQHSGEFFPYLSGSHLLRSGEFIGTVSAPSGRSYPVAAPCDCYLGDLPVSAGAPVIRGAVIARMIKSESSAVVIGALPPSEHWGIRAGDQAVVLTPEGRLSGFVIGINTRRAVEPSELASWSGADGHSSIEIRLTENIRPEFFGSEVAIQINRAQSVFRLFSEYTGLAL